MTKAGLGQVFLVAQIGWGIGAAPAAQAAYSEIARVLQNQGYLIKVLYRLNGGP